MKKLILSVMLAGFAVAVQAGNDKDATPAKNDACCAKAQTTAQVKGQCPMMAKDGSMGCCAEKKAAKEAKVLHSPKAKEMADARR